MDQTNEIPVVVMKRQVVVAGATLPPHVFAAIKALRGWDDLYEVTDDEIATAVREFNSIKMG